MQIQSLDQRTPLSSHTASAAAPQTYSPGAGKYWEIEAIQVALTSSATVGNRQLEIQLLDASSNVVARMVAGIVQAASLTRKYVYSTLLGAEITTFRDTDFLFGALPFKTIPSGYTVKIAENKAIDAAGDRVVVDILYREGIL